ncbi:MAG TPA: hypothetical protein VF070_23995 [Streptosporangiaceae bacterium]
MAELRSEPEDLERAAELLSRPPGGEPRPSEMRIIAGALYAARHSGVPGAVSDEELLAAHDQVCGPLRHSASQALRDLATAMLARGMFPDPGAYNDQWWLWWPKKARGPCPQCGQVRVLARYMGRFGDGDQYMCQKCHRQGSRDAEDALEQATGVTPLPGESSTSLSQRRLAAILQQAKEEGARSAGRPSGEIWAKWVGRLTELLAPLEWAGWELPEEYETDFDFEYGASIFGDAQRTGMAISFEFKPYRDELLLHPWEPSDDALLSALDETAIVQVGEDLDGGRRQLGEVAGDLGLLDATRVTASSDSDVSTNQLVGDRYVEWIFEPAAGYRGIPVSDLLERLMADEEFSGNFKVLAEFFAPGVLPDLIPSAAAIGIVNWCWRNDTAVEDWHLPSDALMAKVSISATRAIMELVGPCEGIDWQGVEESLTSETWQLPDGRLISGLFAEGWPEIQRTVRDAVRKWRRFDEDLLSPDAMLRLLTVAGSSSYTRHWWGQGRWAAICKAIVRDATAAGIALPAPYDAAGAEAFLRDLQQPDAISDEALAWLIDIPSASSDGPRGLRSHSATDPIIHEFELYCFAAGDEPAPDDSEEAS